MSDKQTTEVATTQQNAVVAAPQNYITVLLENVKHQFLEANAGLGLDYVRMGEYLKINKKGNFVLRVNEEQSFGDTLDVVVGAGETRYMLWGKKDTPEDGQLICVEQTEEEAKEVLAAWLEQNPEAQERYALNDIQLRYLAYIVRVEDLGPDSIPEVYLLPLSPTDTLGFGSYARLVYKGDKNIGIPKGCGVNRVITRMTTEERKKEGGTETFLGIKFSAVGMFKPEEFGIQQ